MQPQNWPEEPVGVFGSAGLVESPCFTLCLGWISESTEAHQEDKKFQISQRQAAFDAAKQSLSHGRAGRRATGFPLKNKGSLETQMGIAPPKMVGVLSCLFDCPGVT